MVWEQARSSQPRIGNSSPVRQPSDCAIHGDIQDPLASYRSWLRRIFQGCYSPCVRFQFPKVAGRRAEGGMRGWLDGDGWQSTVLNPRTGVSPVQTHHLYLHRQVNAYLRPKWALLHVFNRRQGRQENRHQGITSDGTAIHELTIIISIRGRLVLIWSHALSCWSPSVSECHCLFLSNEDSRLFEWLR